MKYITQYPRSDRAKGIRRQPEERSDQKGTRAEVPILAQTFEKDHSTGAINTKALAIAIRIALDRKMNDPEYQMLTENRTFTHWSKMLAAYLCYEKITHSADGSISIEELAVYDPFIKQLCHSYYDHTDTQGFIWQVHIRSYPYSELVPSIRTAHTILYAPGISFGLQR